MRRAVTVAGVVLGVLLGCLAPASTFSEAVGRPFVIRALGDSVASGFGLHENFGRVLVCNRTLPTAACDHGAEAYPGLFARGLTAADTGGRPVDFANLAIAGAAPKDLVRAGPGTGALAGRTDRVIRARPDVVVVQVGANDPLHRLPCGLLRSCAQGLLRTLHTAERVRALLRRLRRATAALILVVLYPRSDLDRQGVIELVNRAIRRAAAGLGRVRTVAPPDFGGHGCIHHPKGTWMLPFTVDACLHPNATGHRQLARRLLAARRRG
jgi:lysophospholipase L1-like esterase